jgi:CobQ-like glutamine amidotransferase family enzyme
MTVTLVQLYPEELGVAGDRGNIMALRERLERAGIAVTVLEHRVGDDFPADADLVLVGNGPLSAMRNVYDDLQRIAPTLRALADSGVPIFAYGSGAELLGHDITLLDGTVTHGLGIFPFHAVRVAERTVGYVLVDSDSGQVVGFEDNASVWKLDAAAVPFGRLVEGGGNGDGRTGDEGTEGVRRGASIATQIGGPVLPLNPAVTDAILDSIAERKGLEYSVGTEHFQLDRFASQARAVMVANAKHVFSRI